MNSNQITLVEDRENMCKFIKRGLVASAAVCLVALGSSALAAELPEGTVISAENIDKILNDTFMGHKIADIMTDKQQWYVRNYKKKYPLQKTREPILDPKFYEATKKYSGQVKFDPATREMTGYTAGLPFPDIDPKDPYAGEKIIWNFYYGESVGAEIDNSTNFITANKNGFESSQNWYYQRIYAKNRLWGAAPWPSEPEVFTKTILVGRYPQDVKGVGTFTVRYDQPNRLEDLWAYIKSARRVRRLSGNSWFDNVGGFDFINDDVNIWNARPSIYKSTKLIGKRWILATTDFKPEKFHVEGKQWTGDEWSHLNFKEPPYIASMQQVTPREVWIVEGIPPEAHPYGKKVVYLDTKTFALYVAEIYDKKGDFWRYINFHFDNIVGTKSGITYFNTVGGEMIDFKALHATYWAIYPKQKLDVGFNPVKFSPEILDSLQ